MSPIIIDESSIKPFFFYLDGSLHKGMSHQKRLFWLLDTLNPGDREQIRETYLNLRKQGLTCIITKSERYYRIWTDLRDLPQSAVAAVPMSSFSQFPVHQAGALRTAEYAVLSEALD